MTACRAAMISWVCLQFLTPYIKPARTRSPKAPNSWMRHVPQDLLDIPIHLVAGSGKWEVSVRSWALWNRKWSLKTAIIQLLLNLCLCVCVCLTITLDEGCGHLPLKNYHKDKNKLCLCAKLAHLTHWNGIIFKLGPHICIYVIKSGNGGSMYETSEVKIAIFHSPQHVG